MALICDTGPLYASMDRSDLDHDVCARLLIEFDEPILVPAPVLVELDWLASRRLGPDPFERLLDDVIRGAVRILDVVPGDYARVRDLLVQYRDLDLGFVDAAVIAAAERLGEPKLATLDRRHFATVRPRHVTALRLLPESG